MISESTEDVWRPSSESSQASEDRHQDKKWRKEKTLMMDSRTVKKDMLVGLVEIRGTDGGAGPHQGPEDGRQ